jgi:hypothetical protein
MKISAFECETKTFLKNLKATYYRKVNSPGKDTGKETVTQLKITDTRRIENYYHKKCRRQSQRVEPMPTWI